MIGACPASHLFCCHLFVFHYAHYKVWDEIAYPFNDATVEVWEWVSKFTPLETGHVINYPCWDLTQSVLLECASGVIDYCKYPFSYNRILSDIHQSIAWSRADSGSWWRHQMETFSALLALCAGNSPVPVNSPHKGQWRGALMFSLIYAWINDWVNNRQAGDLRRYCCHYDVNVMIKSLPNEYASTRIRASYTF